MQYNSLINPANACRWLYISSICSGCSSGIILLALPWTLFEHTGRALDVGLLNIIPCILIVVVLPFFSYFLDKFSAKKIYLCLLMFNLMSTTVFSVWAVESNENSSLLFFVFCYAALTRGLEQVARTTLAQQFVNKEKYHEINRNLELVRQIITLFSGIIFALLKEWNLFGILQFCFIINLFSFFILFYVPTPIKKIALTIDINVKQNSITIPFTSLSQTTYFFILVLPYAAIMAQNAIYPSYIHNFLNLPKIYYALMVIPYGIGAFLATYLTKYLTNIAHNILFILMFVVYVFALIIVILIPHWSIFYFALLLFSLLQGIVRIERLTLLMQTYEASFAARAVGFYDFAATMAIIGLTIVCCVLIDTFFVMAAWMAILFILISALIVLCKLPDTALKKSER
jgi:MFS family permease